MTRFVSGEIDSVRAQNAEGFSYVSGVSHNIVLPGDCTNRGGERRRVGGVVTTRPEAGRYPGSIR